MIRRMVELGLKAKENDFADLEASAAGRNDYRHISVSFAGAVGSAILCWKYIKSWYLAAQLQGASTTSGRVQSRRGVWSAPFLPGCSVQHSFYDGLSGCLTQAWSRPWMAQFDDPLGSIMSATVLPTPGRFRPLGPPMFDSPQE
jgi:hypothetical protein